MNGMPIIEGMDTLDIVGLKDSIDDFNRKYTQYVRCSKVNTDGSDDSDDSDDCSNEDMDKGYVLKSYSKVKDNINTLKSNQVSGDILLDPSFEGNYSEMLDKYIELQKMRNEMKINTNEVNDDNRIGKDIESELKHAMYINMMLTILGTTLLYYIFFKYNR